MAQSAELFGFAVILCDVNLHKRLSVPYGARFVLMAEGKNFESLFESNGLAHGCGSRRLGETNFLAELLVQIVEIFSFVSLVKVEVFVHLRV